jgi:UPF0271 protein
MRFDINCDLGEGEPLARTTALMRNITSANVACGGHAGDIETMRQCIRLAKKYRVRLGAHPGSWARDNFGRDPVAIDAAGLHLLLLQQVGALERIAKSERVKLHHIKLHGALYHATEGDPKLAQGYLEIVRRWWPKLIVYAFAEGTVARIASGARVTVWQEAFLDRNYRDDGTLVPRTEANALLTDKADLKRRLESLKHLPLRPRTLCIHSDTPGAADLARLARSTLA